MIIDLAKHAAPMRAPYDVCIVGAGAAGLVLASELSRRGARVAVAESGGRHFEARSQSLCAGTTSGLAFRGLYEGRIRTLGGTTSLWGGQILEIDPHVFTDRPWVTGGAWPIAPSELAPFYERASEIEGLATAKTDTGDVWRALERAPPDLGGDLCTAFSRWCPVTNFAHLYADPLRDRDRLDVYLHASLVKIHGHSDDRTIKSVVVRAPDRPGVCIEARHFVLAVGGIETSRLLLQPALWDDRPIARSAWIGRHFQDHIACAIANIESPVANLARDFDYVSIDGFKYHAKIKMRPEAQRRLGTLDVCGTVAVTTDGVDDLAYAYETYRLWKTRQLASLTLGRLAHFARTLPALLWHKRPSSRALRRYGAAHRLRLVVHCEQDPGGSGLIALGDTRDHLGLVRAHVDWKASPLELHSIRAFLSSVSSSLAAGGLGFVQPDEGVDSDDDKLMARFQESYHHLGGARMASAAASGVVDPSLRVFGTTNLFVCSAAVFPSGGFANPTHTLIALAVRLAEHLVTLRGASGSTGAGRPPSVT